MGWRQGRGIGAAPPPAGAAAAKTGGGRRWGPEAGVGAANTPIYALAPKLDTHGLGHDPFKVLRPLSSPLSQENVLEVCLGVASLLTTFLGLCHARVRQW